MVKQIRNGDLVSSLMDRGDGYFHWLQKVSGLSGPLSSMLADTEFVSVDGLDDILVEKAKEEVRRKYAEDIAEQEDLKDDKDVEVLFKSIRGDICLFEIIVCLSYSINEMFEDLDACDGCEHFFGILLENTGLDKYDEEDLDLYPKEVKEYWKRHIDKILKREYSYYGGEGLFPLKPVDGKEITDRRHISLWQQMNDWVDQHTNEDGEWVD